MANRFVAPTIAVVAILLFSPLSRAQEDRQRQPGAVYDYDRPGEKPAPAPRRDISGIWETATGPGAGTQAKGAQLYPSSEDGQLPSSGRPEGEPPYTPLGWEAFLANKPSVGATMVLSALTNDPVPACNPQGFPRIALHDFRTSRIIQTPENVVILYEFNKKWRTIWTDGRELPKNPEEPTWGSPNPAESRWWGYSVGKWADDYNFVANSNGFDDRTWLDNAGLPHSDALRVEERYHRLDAVHLEMTITIDDPKMYTKPWVALDKLRLRLQAASFDIPEEECAPLETEEYNKEFAKPAAGAAKTK